MTSPALNSFICNLCGAVCPRPDEPYGREVPGCPQCSSTLRLRGIVALLSQELFGTQLAAVDFPELKGVRGFGMSDPPNLATQLQKKFDYTNTFYHQPPTIDITNPPESECGRYDFIISSEVMEHVPPPIKNGFANLYRLLKPNGVLLLTVPYRIQTAHLEHYPELYEYTLASPGGKTVLVNRRRDGSLETFENLCFHGGDGSTLELRVFSEDELKSVILSAGFDEVCVAAEAIPEFGIEHSETWSLPIVARKGKIQLQVSDLTRAYHGALEHQRQLAKALEITEGEYRRYIAFHNESHAAMERELQERLIWNTQTQQALEERTNWAFALDKERQKLISQVAELSPLTEECANLKARISDLDLQLAKNLQETGRAEKLAAERTAWAQARDKDYEELLKQIQSLKARKWARLGRKLGLAD